MILGILGAILILLLLRAAAKPRSKPVVNSSSPTPSPPPSVTATVSKPTAPTIQSTYDDEDLLDDDEVDEDILMDRAERRAAKAKLVKERENARHELYEEIITIFFSSASKQEKIAAIHKAEEHFVSVYRSRLNPDRMPNLMAAFRKVGKHYEDVIKGPNHTKVQRLRYRIRKRIREGEMSVKEIPWEQLHDIVFPDQAAVSSKVKSPSDDIGKLKRRRRSLETYIAKRPESESLQSWKEELSRIVDQLARLEKEQ